MSDSAKTVKARVVLCVMEDGSYTGEGWTNASAKEVQEFILMHHQIGNDVYHFVTIEADVPLPESQETVIQGTVSGVDKV